MTSRYFLCLILILFTGIIYANEDDEMMGKAINRAGLQRMLTQRLAKSYLAVLTKTNMHVHVSQIQNDIALFEKNYDEIRAIKIVAGNAQRAIKVAEKLWAEYKPLVTAPPSLENAALILEMNTKILGKCNDVVVALERQAKAMGTDGRLEASYGELAYLINISGRQRMLSQRIMLYYLANRLKIDPNAASAELERAIQMYSKSLNELMGSLENTPEIDFKLVRLTSDWKKLEVLCQNLDKLSEAEIGEIITMGDLLLSEMNMVTNMYEDLVDTQIASLMVGNAMNKAGRQRMLTQQMAKAYISIVLDIDVKNNENELENAMNLFSKSLVELKRYAPMAEISDAIEQVEYLWKDYNELLSDYNRSKEKAEKVLQQNTIILRACHNVVLMLKVYAKSMGEHVRFDNELVSLIDKAGRQRMLSQRMVLYCMASTKNLGNETTGRHLQETIDDYGKALGELSINNRNTDEINTKLEVVQQNWSSITGLCASGSGDTELLAISNQLLRDMDQITALYEQIISNLMDGEAINKAGRQRMLTQRIALGTLAISMNLDVNVRQQQLKKDVSLFARQLDELKVYIGNGKAKSSLNKVVALWKNYKQLATGRLTDESVQQLVGMNTELLQACNKVTIAIVAESKKVDSQIANLINIAGRQRMLSQRITLHALARRKGLFKDECEDVLNTSIAEYKRALDDMQQASLNTPEIYNTLDKMQEMAERLDGYVKNIDSTDLYQILISSNILLSEAEGLVKAYEKIGDERIR